MLDSFAAYLAEHLIYPAFDHQSEIHLPVEDEYGMPVFFPDRRVEMRTLKLIDFFYEKGVVEVAADALPKR